MQTNTKQGLTQRLYQSGSSGAPRLVTGLKWMLSGKLSWSGKVISETRNSEIVKLCCWVFSLLYLCGFFALAAYREKKTEQFHFPSPTRTL